MIEFISLRHAYPESAGFCIDRKAGHENYTFLHFFNNVEIAYNGEIIEVAPHSVIIYDKNVPQYFKSNVPLIHDWMHFDGDIEDILAENGLQLNTIYHPTQTEFITKLTQEIESEFYGAYQNSQKLMQYKFEELIIKLGRAVTENAESDIAQRTKDKFRRLRGEVFANLAENWTLERMANMMNYSESHFCTVYKAIYGISPTADIINARVNSAKNLLEFSNKKVSEIASTLGYWNITHFIRQFKDRTGLSPNEYRKRRD